MAFEHAFVPRKKRPPLARRPFFVGRESGLALRELEAFAGAGLAGLFAFLHARVACEETFLLEREAQGLVDLDERPADCQTQGAGLAIDAAADGADGEVVGVNGVGDFQRAKNLILNREAGEVVGEVTAVDLDGTGAWLQADAGDGGLAATCGLDGCGFAHTKNQAACGFCAVWGCSAPA